jgi:hypothetical protein
MAFVTVRGYALGFSVADKRFSVYYWLEDRSTVTQLFVDATQFSALADMFRNEGPVYYETDGQYFVTSQEVVGEGEPAQG